MAEISAREAVTAAALRGDAVQLRAVAAELPLLEANSYDRHRALAFAAALDGERDRAFAQLKLGGGAETPQRLRVDVAALELLLGEPSRALTALRLAVRDERRLEPEVATLLAESVRRGGASRDAILLGVGSGTPAQRTRSAAIPAPVVARDALDFVVPAIAVVSLVVAIVALARLPLLQDDTELAISAPQSRAPVVVVAKLPQPEPRERPAPSPDSQAPSPAAASIPVAARAPSRAPSPRPARTSPSFQPRPSEVDRAAQPPDRERVLAVAAKPQQSTASAAQRLALAGPAPPGPPSATAVPGPPGHADRHGKGRAPAPRG